MPSTVQNTETDLLASDPAFQKKQALLALKDNPEQAKAYFDSLGPERDDALEVIRTLPDGQEP